MRDRIKGLKRIASNKLVPHPENWRLHPEKQRKALAASLSTIGWANAIIARPLSDGRYQILDGHLRAEEADGKVPVLVVDVDDDEARMMLLTIDPMASMAEQDDAMLKELIRSVTTDSADMQELLDTLAKSIVVSQVDIVEDEVPEPPAKSITQPGDLWLLGDHRLLCGDSTNKDHVDVLFDGGEEAMLLATDPPYGVDFAGQKYNPRAKAWDGIANDKLAGNELQSFISSSLEVWLPHVSKQAGFYFWTAAMQEGAAAAAAIRAAGLHIQSQIIWNKNCLVLGQADYHWKHENCWYAFWKGEQHRWYGGRNQVTVWDVKKVANNDYVHPMQKPVELYAIPMKMHTMEGELVAEPFAGSGSQFIAAEQLNRRCYGMELSPQYCDVIVERYRSWCQKSGTPFRCLRNGEQYPTDAAQSVRRVAEFPA